MAPAPTLAKFSRPRLYAVVKRERLFRLIDDARAHPVIFIAGPPGAGKTTLVASYVEVRRTPGLWFQADAGDADPPTFFHYLAVAAASIGGKAARKASSLPRWNPGYANELAAFTRRFLREFFALFPPARSSSSTTSTRPPAARSGARRSSKRSPRSPPAST